MRPLFPALLLLVPTALLADDTAPPKPDGKDDAVRLGGQVGDDTVEPLDPKEPRTEEEEKKVEARAWFMKGRIQEGRSELQEALESYEKAIDLDPTAVDVYRAYVPLAFTLRKNEQAIARALKLVELDPDNHSLMQQLGRQLARTGKVGEAILLLEKATEAPSLNKKSSAFVSLNRDLSVLYGATNQTEKLADAYEVVFEALVNPDKYELEIAEHSALERDRALGYERMGEAFLNADRVERAARALSIAAERNGGRPSGLNYNLARVHHSSGNARRAKAELDKYLDARLKDKGRAAYELLAEIYEDLDESDDLVPRLEALAERDGRNNPLLSFLGDQYVSAERYDDAEELFTRIAEKNRHPLGQVGLAKLYRVRGETGKLLDALTAAFQSGSGIAPELQPELKAIAEDEKTLKALVAEGRKRAGDEEADIEFVTCLILAGFAGEADDLEASIEFHRLALDRAEDDRKPSIQDDLADKLIEAERYDEAITLLKEAAASVTDNAQKSQFLYKLSQAQELSGNTDAALETITEARKLLPENPLLHYQHGWINYHAERYDEAVRIFEQVLEEHAGNNAVTRTVRFSLSNVFVRTKQLRKAEEVLEVILEEDPEDPSVNNDLGYLYADAGHNLEKAEKMIRIAIEAEPDNAAYQDSMGWVLYRLKKYDEALPWLVKACNDPDGADPTIWDHLADCQHAMGKKEEAIESWRKALAAFDEDRPDEDLRKKIEAKIEKAEE